MNSAHPSRTPSWKSLKPKSSLKCSLQLEAAKTLSLSKLSRMKRPPTAFSRSSTTRSTQLLPPQVNLRNLRIHSLPLRPKIKAKPPPRVGRRSQRRRVMEVRVWSRLSSQIVRVKWIRRRGILTALRMNSLGRRHRQKVSRSVGIMNYNNNNKPPQKTPRNNVDQLKTNNPHSNTHLAVNQKQSKQLRAIKLSTPLNQLP